MYSLRACVLWAKNAMNYYAKSSCIRDGVARELGGLSPVSLSAPPAIPLAAAFPGVRLQMMEDIYASGGRHF